MGHKTDNIYIYFWEELSTIYVGRTINPKSRHYQHRHIPTEKTYKFSSEHNVEHPKMIIIENDLSIEEGVKREKYWIEYYRNNTTYNVLNKTSGGQIGGKINRITLTEEEKKQRQKEYYQKNRDRIIEYRKNYAKTHKKEVKKEIKKKSKKRDRKKYYREHREEILAKQKKYRKEHREEVLIQRKKHREKNKEKILVYKKKYREKHREELRVKARKYMADKRNIEKNS